MKIINFNLKKFFSLKNFKKILASEKSAYKAFYFDVFISILIIISCIIFVIETYKPLNNILLVIEHGIMFIFTIEFILRNYFAKNKKKYLFSIYNILDFLAIFPFIFGIASLQFLRSFRILKIILYISKFLQSKKISKRKLNTILIFKMISVMTIVLYISSSFLYTFENSSNQNINNIADAFYASLVTITTVGFGDIVPQTVEGRFVVMGVIMFGVFLIPIYISSILESLLKNKGKKHFVCKKCGFSSHDDNAVYCKMCGDLLYHEHGD